MQFDGTAALIDLLLPALLVILFAKPAVDPVFVLQPELLRVLFFVKILHEVSLEIVEEVEHFHLFLASLALARVVAAAGLRLA